MLIKIARGWEMPERLATPEPVFMNRRQLMAAAGAGTIAMALPGMGGRARAAEGDPSAGLYPAGRNPQYTVERAITPEEINTHYNNFYEFGSTKQVAEAAQQLKTRPWEIEIDGEVEKPFTIGIDELLAKMTLEERVYRHRCVEAWSMVVPWTGFPMAKLVALAKPLSAAKYVRMETFLDPDIAPGQRPSVFPWANKLPWPYVEGLTIEEAANELTFLVTGAYGKPVARQMGAPIRLHTPWKYGFKSLKSIVRFSFVRERPVGFWEDIQAREYGFWANVNPEVPHPRWSQATERVLGTGDRVPTRIFNGYGEYVADLYKDKTGEKLFM